VFTLLLSTPACSLFHRLKVINHSLHHITLASYLFNCCDLTGAARQRSEALFRSSAVIRELYVSQLIAACSPSGDPWLPSSLEQNKNQTVFFLLLADSSLQGLTAAVTGVDLRWGWWVFAGGGAGSHHQ